MTVDRLPNGWGRAQRHVELPTLLRLEARTPRLIVEHPDLGILLAAPGPRARWTIGRAPWCELELDWDPAVSRSHAILEAFGPLLTIEPAGEPTNALKLGATDVVGRTELADRGRLTIGETTLHVRIPADAGLEQTLQVDGAPEPPAPLTRAERRVAQALDAEPQATNRELAARLGLHHETVRTHLAGVLRKARAATGDPAVDRTTVIAALAAAGLYAPGD